ncbi:Zinc finger protein [Tetrabaena socialis]|uniref:Zinc finger protein n=1 Tax=Tetrabaena socialis TaxID=47790 RepID=A0A2J7ZRV7_9CHLO|nr:Zinc finger protein [Tetrabaena socialis]|eukprot:PNH03002.1 Zinc finger protein [Tetrabaena socialis]
MQTLFGTSGLGGLRQDLLMIILNLMIKNRAGAFCCGSRGVPPGSRAFPANADALWHAWACDLTRHKRLKHTGEKPYACDYESCGAAFTQRHHLTAHKSSIHSPEGQARQKKQEQRVALALDRAGIQYKREHQIDFRCIGGDAGFWARVDFVIVLHGRVIFLEAKKYQWYGEGAEPPGLVLDDSDPTKSTWTRYLNSARGTLAVQWRGPLMVFVASRNIPAGVELLADYNVSSRS